MSLLEFAPRLGQVLNLVAGIAAAGAALLSATVVSVNGVVPMVVLAPLVAIGFFLRFGGATYALGRGQRAMPWGPRIGSWAVWGMAVVLFGLAGATLLVGIFAAFVVLDGAAGFAYRGSAEERQARKPVKWRVVAWTLAALAYAAGVVAFQLLVAPYLSYGALLTWSLIALGFAFAVRMALVGPKAPETWLRAPVDHKRHERREERVADPARERAESVLAAFRGRGDAAPFIELVREAARGADLRDEDLAILEQRILASFARAGTRRDEDVRAALDEVESFLSLSSKPVEVRP